MFSTSQRSPHTEGPVVAHPEAEEPAEDHLLHSPDHLKAEEGDLDEAVPQLESVRRLVDENGEAETIWNIHINSGWVQYKDENYRVQMQQKLFYLPWVSCYDQVLSE